MIEIKNVVKKYGNFVVLEDGNLSIATGSTFGLVGINGAGKSTLLRMLAGIFSADSGSICINGEPVFDNKKIKKDILFLPDEPFYNSLSNGEQVAEIYKTFYSFNNNTFLNYTTAYNLDLKAPLRSYSKGMKKRLFVSLAFASNPKYLFLDEVFDGIDPAARLIFKNGLAQLKSTANTTVVMASHSLRDLADICDSFSLIDGKKIRATKTISSTSNELTKLRIAFLKPATKEHFSNIKYLYFETTGNIATIIFKGSKESFIKNINNLNLKPFVIDELSIDFEEYFLSEECNTGRAYENADIGDNFREHTNSCISIW